MPELDTQQRNAGGEWRGVVAVDVYGTLGGGNGRLTLEAVDSDSGEVLAAGTTEVEHRASIYPWGVIFSSDMQRNRAFLAFDGHRETIWQSEQGNGGQWIGVEFGSPTRMTGVNYTPHNFSNANGVARRYRVDVRQAGGAWQTVASGQRPTNSRTTLEVTFPGQDAVAIRFVIETDWSGNGYGSAARIELPGVQFDPVPVQAPTRAWLEIPPQVMSGLEGKSFELRVLNDSQNAVVIGAPRPRFDHAHLAPDTNLLNRDSGRFKLGAGLLGFDALYEDKRNILTVMTVRPGTPAAEQQMVRGDVILAVRGRPLSFNNLSRGWEWFHHGHETIIGRETEAAVQAGETTLPLTLLRDGVAVDIQLPLNRVAAFTTMNPTHDPEAARMLTDCLGFLARTSFSALAMLATGKPEHIDRARNAVRWAQARYKKPVDYGGLGFWYGAYAGLLYSEWHLATGDTSVLPNLQALRDWVIGGSRMSRFGIRALGHGPYGLPYNLGGLVASTCHLLVVESLAMRAGLESGIWELILPYMGEEDLINAAYALVLQAPRRTLHLTGLPQVGEPTPINWAVHDTTSPSDVSTVGDLVASCTGHDDGNDYTLNGVTFRSGRIPGMPSSGVMSSARQPQGVAGDYKAFLSNWSAGEPFDGDKNGDGISNGLAFLLGATDPDADALDLLPEPREEAGGLVIAFSMRNAGHCGDAKLFVEHSNDLGTHDEWTQVAVPETSATVDDVIFVVTPNGPLNDVVATIPAALARDGRLFVRLSCKEN